MSCDIGKLCVRKTVLAIGRDDGRRLRTGRVPQLSFLELYLYRESEREGRTECEDFATSLVYNLQRNDTLVRFARYIYIRSYINGDIRLKKRKKKKREIPARSLIYYRDCYICNYRRAT